jgi:hypothetical protein
MVWVSRRKFSRTQKGVRNVGSLLSKPAAKTLEKLSFFPSLFRGGRIFLCFGVLVYYQNALLARRARHIGDHELQTALVDLLGIQPRFREKLLQALRLLSLRSYNRLGALARAVTKSCCVRRVRANLPSSA